MFNEMERQWVTITLNPADLETMINNMEEMTEAIAPMFDCSFDGIAKDTNGKSAAQNALEWMYENYDTAAVTIRALVSMSSILSTAIANGEIEFAACEPMQLDKLACKA